MTAEAAVHDGAGVTTRGDPSLDFDEIVGFSNLLTGFMFSS